VATEFEDAYLSPRCGLIFLGKHYHAFTRFAHSHMASNMQSLRDKLLLRSIELRLSRFDAYKRLECTSPACAIEDTSAIKSLSAQSSQVIEEEGLRMTSEIPPDKTTSAGSSWQRKKGMLSVNP
jgi:hypothetical protein